MFYEGKLLSKPVDIADCQNQYFVDKVKNILSSMPPPISDPLYKLKLLMRNRNSVFCLRSAHPDEVQKIILELRNSKSTGLDTIDSYILKCSLPYILPAVTHIVNESINSGIFPSQWKTAKVIPLLKSGDSLNPKNYRPVAMLPILSKVLEKVVFCQVSEYMEENGLMHPNHHGFRRNHSTATCLIQLYDRWVAALEEKKFTGVCYLDLSAAFDVVNHSLLVEKLSLYGFDKKSIKWIKSYLKDRKQAVCIEGKLSKVLSVTSGVPQGSILGPLFYTIFTNELPEIIHNHVGNGGYFQSNCNQSGSLCCYADDSSFSFSSQSIDTIQDELYQKYNDISNYMVNNRLKLNGDKTHLMLLGTDKSWRSKLTDDSLKLSTDPNSNMIKTSRCEKVLGCIVSQNLKWADHILLNEKSLVRQLSSRLNALKSISVSASFKTRLMIANGLFLSKMAYAMPVWGGCEDFLVRSLQTVQNKAARLVCRKGIYTPISTLLSECNWLSVSQLIVQHSLVLFYKIQKCHEPKYLYEMFTTERRYNTRGEGIGKLDCVAVNPPTLSINSRSFRWRTVQLWNQLPASLRQSKSLVDFKAKLKTWIRENVAI